VPSGRNEEAVVVPGRARAPGVSGRGCRRRVDARPA